LLGIRYQFYQAEKWDSLVSQAYGYQIEYPANWKGEVINSGRGSDYLHGRINDRYLFPRSYMLIHSHPLSDPTFKEGALWGEEIIKRDCGYICWEEFQTTHIGIEEYLALSTTYQEKDSLGRILHKEAIIIVENEAVYMLQFNTYDSSQETENILNHMLESFRIVEEGE
jgi:hypothetical protein